MFKQVSSWAAVRIRFLCRIAPSLVLLAGPCVSPAASQTLPSGIINVPPTVIGDVQSIGSNTTLNVSEGGTVGFLFEAGLPDGSSQNVFVNIDGGVVGGLFYANSGSIVDISGGVVATVEAFSGSTVSVSGGNLGSLTNRDGGEIELRGGDFRLNGQSYSGSSITLSEGDVFSGVYEDGTQFLFGSELNDGLLIDALLTPATIPALDTNPIVFSSAQPVVSSGVRPGQNVTLLEGGVFSDFSYLYEAKLTIDGGEVGHYGLALNSEVNIVSGTLKGAFEALDGTKLRISGGDVGPFWAGKGTEVIISGGSVSSFTASDSVVSISGGNLGSGVGVGRTTLSITGGSISGNFRAGEGSVVHFRGGAIGNFADAKAGSTFYQSGGSIGVAFEAESGSVVTISGGTRRNDFDANGGSTVNFIGTDFFLDGVLIDLEIGETTIITERGGTLSGILADGTPFSHDLFTTDEQLRDFFSTDATLTVTLVPEPSSLFLVGLLSIAASCTRKKAQTV